MAKRSAKRDAQIRSVASVIGSLPVFGDLYIDDYLAAWGKMGHSEFKMRLIIHSLASSGSIAAGPAYYSRIDLAAGATKETYAYQAEYIELEEYLRNQGAVAVDFLGGEIVEGARPMKYARARPFSARWLLGPSENYRRVNSIIEAVAAFLYDTVSRSP